MRILITGSEGVLGKPLKAELRRRGHDVYGCDLAHSADPQVMRADVGEYRQLQRVFDFAKPDTTFHLAGEFGRINGTEYAEQLYKTNSLGTHNVIEECIRVESKLIFASSSEAYGDLADRIPKLTEDSLDDLVPVFHNEYALSKFTNEKQIQTAIRHRGLCATILRFFNVYGPGEIYSPYRSVVCLFIYRLMHNLPITVYANCRRSLLYVDDWSRSTANAVDPLFVIPNGCSINVGSDEQVTMYELFEHVRHALQYIGIDTTSTVTIAETEPGNVTDKRPSLERARKYLDHDPQIILSVGTIRTAEWQHDFYGVK